MIVNCLQLAKSITFKASNLRACPNHAVLGSFVRSFLGIARGLRAAERDMSETNHAFLEQVFKFFGKPDQVDLDWI